VLLRPKTGIPSVGRTLHGLHQAPRIYTEWSRPMFLFPNNWNRQDFPRHLGRSRQSCQH
jgi:hypothetical protein